MKGKNRWLLPEGIEELLPEPAARLEQLRREILDLYRSWGYQLIIPPFIDYLDSLLTGTGHDLDLQTLIHLYGPSVTTPGSTCTGHRHPRVRGSGSRGR